MFIDIRRWGTGARAKHVRMPLGRAGAGGAGRPKALGSQGRREEGVKATPVGEVFGQVTSSDGHEKHYEACSLRRRNFFQVGAKVITAVGVKYDPAYHFISKRIRSGICSKLGPLPPPQSESLGVAAPCPLPPVPAPMVA